MRFTWWLRSLFRSPSKTYIKKRSRRILNLEQLESRLAPATFTWTGAGGNNLWSTPGNWAGNTAPLSTSTADNLVFNGSPALALRSTNDDIANVNVGAITISGSGYILASTTNHIVTLGNTLTGGGTLNVTAANEIISLAIKLGGPSAPSVAQNTFTVGFGSKITITGHLIGASGTELITNGPGTVVLAADNSGSGIPSNGFNGPIQVHSGILSITNANALGNFAAATNTTTVETNATLQVDNTTNSITAPIKEKLLLNGPGTTNQGALANLAGNSTWAGTITLDSNSTIGSAAGNLTISGVIGDNATGHNLTKEGAAKVTFTAANTYRGVITINNGILDIQNSKALGAADGTASTGTVVNSTLTETGTLELEDPTGVGFTVNNELLTQGNRTQNSPKIIGAVH
jgi:autotransporter-associated beta strand protein